MGQTHTSLVDPAEGIQRPFVCALKASPIVRTANQKVVWNYLCKKDRILTSYASLEADLLVSGPAIRKVLTKFEKEGLITKQTYRKDGQQGMIITVLERSAETGQTPAKNKEVRPTGQTHGTDPVSSSVREIERKNLSISDKLRSFSSEDFEFHYPALAKIGFGPSQISQILDRLDQVGKEPTQIFEGLEHANWELENGPLKDKAGSVVESPAGFIFNSLARWGYYRKPKGYVSAEEQAVKDRAEKDKGLLEARKVAQEAEFSLWQAELSAEKLHQIEERMKSKKGNFLGPKETWLKEYWSMEHKDSA